MDFVPLLRGIGARLKIARENADLSINQVAAHRRRFGLGVNIGYGVTT